MKLILSALKMKYRYIPGVKFPIFNWVVVRVLTIFEAIDFSISDDWPNTFIVYFT